jgi:UDP-glucose 4-epimerase
LAILVTGGAGYIGSVTVERLRQTGEEIVVLDDLARGHRETVEADVPFYKGRIGDRQLVERIIKDHKIESCIHFAALAYVGESVEKPASYFENNVEQGLAFMRVLLEAGVRRLVFSSTCATYGEPPEMPIREQTPQWPKNPYGWSKLILERALDSYDRAYALKFVALRYFNACGATATLGENHDPEPHLIPNVLAACAGRKKEVSVFGNDYPTPDGTAIRDYVHVSDLAEGHSLALEYLRKGGTSDFINLGTGTGSSVFEVIEKARKVTGREIQVRCEPRRAGDPSRLVADSTKAKALLDWNPRSSDLFSILNSQWEWNNRNPNGYAPVVKPARKRLS